MADNSYQYAQSQLDPSVKESSITLPNSLMPGQMISDELLNSVGLYSRKQIETSKWDSYSRFGRVLDPYGRVNSGREYLFFVKPDLHICMEPGASQKDDIYKLGGSFSGDLPSSKNGSGTTMYLNPQLVGSPYFKDLIKTNPEVIKQLQYGLDPANPFCNLLSFTCSSYLQMAGVDATTLDTPKTVFGTSYEYLKDSEASNENPSFSLEFVDNDKLDVYHFFKAYSEYHLARKSGLVTPPNLSYYRYRRLHNTMGIYKFIVAEDMETILYYAYFWGVFPVSTPREAFSDPSFGGEGLTFEVNFKGAFIEDMNPNLLWNFNQLMSKVMTKHSLGRNNYLPVIQQGMYKEFSNYSADMVPKGREFNMWDYAAVKETKTDSLGNSTYTSYNISATDQIVGKLPKAAMVQDFTAPNGKRSYKLRWYG